MHCSPRCTGFIAHSDAEVTGSIGVKASVLLSLHPHPRRSFLTYLLLRDANSVLIIVVRCRKALMEPLKMTCSTKYSFIVQLVRALHRYRIGTGSNPTETLISFLFFVLLFCSCVVNCVHSYDDHS